MKKFTYMVSERQGMHARNAMQFAKVAESFTCRITIEGDGRKADGKNVLSLMGMAIKQGEFLQFILDGEDEEQALGHLESLVKEIL